MADSKNPERCLAASEAVTVDMVQYHAGAMWSVPRIIT